jgi:transcription-repair coupling factor (superfamily II helicase)
VIVVPSVEESRRLAAALRTWMEAPERLLAFPEPPGLLYERVPWPPEVITDRLDVLSQLCMCQAAGTHEPFVQAASDSDRPCPVVVTSARALMRRTLPFRQFRRAIRRIAVGAHESLTELTRHATGIGYEPVSVVQAPGQLSRRGGLLDIYPPQATQPYRLEFFGDEIDTIRTFDPETQRSTGRTDAVGSHVASMDAFWLTPVREALPRDSARALEAVMSLLATNPPPEYRSILEADAEALEAQVPFPNLEFYLPYLYQEGGTLLHYLPSGSMVVLYNSDQLDGVWTGLEEEASEQRQTARTEKVLFADSPVPYTSWDQMSALLSRYQTLSLASSEEALFDDNPPSRTTPGVGGAAVEALVASSAPGLAEAFGPEPHFAGKLPDALGRIRQWLHLGDQVVIVSRQAPRMAELWQDFSPPPVLQDLPSAPAAMLTFVQGVISGGWQWRGIDGIHHLITDEELFGWNVPEPRRSPRRRAVTPEQGFADFQPGDIVVHEDYGIGIYRGLVTRSVDAIDREYLYLEYAGPGGDRTVTKASLANGTEHPDAWGDKLLVPIHQADRLSRYVGAEGIGARLSRLGGGSWEETKARVAKAAAELAAELLDLYATRQVVHGRAFEPDSQWQRELEAAFPFAETEDQIEAIHAVKQDMETARPMDRLICGDAGYGKTEVALRAAFKAVMDNTQVAMLVPTTVLAQQHYQTFVERLAPFPVKVELLSRFRTEAEQHRVLEALSEGHVDIVIGTHRLLQKDVAIRNLGLVIIDEEQRFGVAHKERLKQMRTEVDVLTLTATPIPRTLYMALAGVRDISIIETPPQERLPIATYVGTYDAKMARRAIVREVNRGGQVFYVHNRVGSIETVAARLHALVPDADLAVAHGQMPERELSKVMERFTAGDVKVLLATTIIESGLDFPNANTLIVERADRFGLAQLYQLRGRIGRGTRRGYAYFFHKRRMTDEASQRLAALRDTSTRGGGFTVALRDLEIRGAGELLGNRQHGHVAAVGFTLYTRMLSRAVSHLKAAQAGEPIPPEAIGSITIELPLPVGLSSDYVPDDKLRLQLYRRLADLSSEDELAQLQEELQDRFGPLPPMAENLMYQLRLKLLARDARIPAIAVESGQIVLRPSWLKDEAPSRVTELRRSLQDRARVGRREIWLPMPWEETTWRDSLRQVLQILADWWNRPPT